MIFLRNSNGQMVELVYQFYYHREHPNWKMEYLGYYPVEGGTLDANWPARLSDLRKKKSRWKLIDPENATWIYETFPYIPERVRSADTGVSSIVLGTPRFGQPLSKEEQDGYKWTFTYGARGELSKIIDSFGRELSFSYAQADFGSLAGGGFAAGETLPVAISSITLPDENTLHYTYDVIDDSVPANIVRADRLRALQRKTPAGTLVEQRTYHYEDSRFPTALTGITDHDNVRIRTYSYDNEERVISTERANGTQKYTISYGDTVPIMTRTVTNPLGKVSVYKFQATETQFERVFQARFIGVDGQASANCPASAKSIAYSTQDFVSTTTDEEGRVTKYQRDSLGRPTSITRAFGTPEAVATTYAYHPTLNVPTQMVEPGRTTNYTWDSNGRLTQISKVDTTTHAVPYSTNGETRTTTYTYTGAAGLLASVDGPLTGTSDTTSYTYNASGYVTSITNEVGHITTITAHNARGQPTSVTDANGVVTTLTYDFQGRLLTTTVNPGANQAVTSFEYDAIGQVTKVTRPDGSYFTYTYDDARRLTTITADNGEKIEMTHDLMGNVTNRTIKSSGGAIAYQHAQTFDELGRLLTQIGANSQTTTYAYEKNDNLKSVTDPRAGVYSYAYDAVNRLIRETDQDASQVNLTLDGQGETTTYADPRNLQTTYVRNGFGEIIRQTSPDSGITDHVRDLRGLITETTDARGVIMTMTYDAAGRMLTKAFPASTSENVTYAYDSTVGGNYGVGRLTSMAHEGGSIIWTYDARGNVTSEVRTIAGVAQTVLYAYDTADNLTQITYPSGREVSYGRDASGRITSVATRRVSSDPWSNVLTGIVYQPQSRLVQQAWFANGLNDWNTYTQDYELDVLGLYDGATSLISRAHTRTDGLNLTNIFDNVTPANNTALSYSPANRLQNASGTWGSKTFYYDGVGNRIEERVTPPGGSETISTLGYPATSNRVTQITQGATTVRSIGYDAAGNITSDSRLGSLYAYTYNDANRLKTVAYEGNLKGTYTYNGLHQLITRIVTNSGTADGTTHYVHDRNGNVIAELDASGASVREYIWLPEAEIAPTMASRAPIDRPIATVDGISGGSPTLYYVHTDHLHRPVKMSDASKAFVWQAEYQPWGAVQSLSGALTLDLRFPGQWFQLEAGLHYNWHRHYDPSLGRYTQADPLGFVDGPSVYGYAGGSPQLFVDPTGEMAGGRYTVECGRCLLIYDSDQWKGAHTHWQCPGQPQGCIKKDGELCDGSDPPPPEIKKCLIDRKRIPVPECDSCQEKSSTIQSAAPWVIGAACAAACILQPELCLPALILGGAAAR